MIFTEEELISMMIEKMIIKDPEYFYKLYKLVLDFFPTFLILSLPNIFYPEKYIIVKEGNTNYWRIPYNNSFLLYEKYKEFSFGWLYKYISKIEI